MGGADFDDAHTAQIRACFPDEEVREFLTGSGLDPAAYLSLHESDLAD